MAFNQRLIVVQTPINAREKRKRKKRSFAHFVFNFCSFRFCDYRGGLAELSSTHESWVPGDDYTGDPAQEPQGLNSVFASDSTTLSLIRSFTLNVRGK